MTTETKVCNRCETEKPITEFYANGPSKGGRMGHCRDCNNQGRRATPGRMIRNRARSRAYAALADRHREEFEQLLEAETAQAIAEHEAIAAEAAARGNADAEVARIKRGPKRRETGESSTLERIDVARCPSCHQHHDAAHLCPTCGEDTTEPPEEPRSKLSMDVDWVVVERRIIGDRVEMTRGERLEVVRRLLGRGMSDSAIQKLTGIHCDQVRRDRVLLGISPSSTSEQGAAS